MSFSNNFSKTSHSTFYLYQNKRCSNLVNHEYRLKNSEENSPIRKHTIRNKHIVEYEQKILIYR